MSADDARPVELIKLLALMVECGWDVGAIETYCRHLERELARHSACRATVARLENKERVLDELCKENWRRVLAAEQRVRDLRQALKVADSLMWMAQAYAEASGGVHSIEMQEYLTVRAAITLALESTSRPLPLSTSAPESEHKEPQQD